MWRTIYDNTEVTDQSECWDILLLKEAVAISTYKPFLEQWFKSHHQPT